MQTDPAFSIRTTSLAAALRPGAWRFSLLHAAPEPRIFWITHGQARAIVGPRRRGLGVNNYLYVPPNQPFALDPGATLNGYLVKLPTAASPAATPSPVLIRTRDAAEQGEIAGLIEGLRREEAGQRSHHDEAMAAQATLIRIWQARQAAALAESEPDRSTAADRLISAFFDVLERGFRDGRAMADYAEQLDVTPTHLSRVCKSRLGLSAAQLMTERTLHAARLALETTDTRAKEIAAALGFGSPAYFSRFILAHTGQPPRALRNRAREGTAGCAAMPATRAAPQGRRVILTGR